MADTLNELIEKSHAFLKEVETFHRTREQDFAQLHLFITKPKKTKSPADKKTIAEKLYSLDYRSKEFCSRLASLHLGERNVSPTDIQTLLSRIDEFKEYSPRVFAEYGVFLSCIMKKVLKNEPTIDFSTNNTATVHIPRFHILPGTDVQDPLFPWKIEESYTYDRDNLLLSHLANGLTTGTVSITGNVAKFFAMRNNGAQIQLRGDCGWKACRKMHSGTVTIHGFAGPDFASDAEGGTSIIFGELESVGGSWYGQSKHRMFLNGREYYPSN